MQTCIHLIVVENFTSVVSLGIQIPKKLGYWGHKQILSIINITVVWLLIILSVDVDITPYCPHISTGMLPFQFPTDGVAL